MPTVHKLLYARQDLKAGAISEFGRQTAAKGEHGEAGSRAARVNEPTCDQVRIWWAVTQENYETAGQVAGHYNGHHFPATKGSWIL